jgi:hypothetical protein
MGLFDLFRKRSPRRSLQRICYDIAYTALPHVAFNDCDELVKMFKEGPISVGAFYYVKVCQALKVQIVREDAKRFREHCGKLDDSRDYFVLQYPTPPPIDFTGVNLGNLPREQIPVLAPYFSAVLRHHQTGAVDYLALGQALEGGGTTLRTVTPDGANGNLGPGPEPQLDAFLDRLRNSRP